MSQFSAGRAVIQIVAENEQLKAKLAESRGAVKGFQQDVEQTSGGAPLTTRSAVNIAGMASTITQVLSLIDKLDVGLRGLTLADRDFGASMRAIDTAFGSAFTGGNALTQRIEQIEETRKRLIAQAEEARDNANFIVRMIEKAAGDPTFHANQDKINEQARKISLADKQRAAELEKVKGLQTDIAILAEKERLSLDPKQRLELQMKQLDITQQLMEAQFNSEPEKAKVRDLIALQREMLVVMANNEKVAARQRARDAVQAYRDEVGRGFGLQNLGGGSGAFVGPDQQLGMITSLLPLLARNGGR